MRSLNPQEVAYQRKSVCMPELEHMENPINMDNIYNHQQQDNELLHLVHINPTHYMINNIGGLDIITRKNRNDDQWKICLPMTLAPNVIEWYHYTLGHAGIQRLYDTISKRFCIRGLYKMCEEYVCPENCKQWKHLGQGYGHLPPRNALVAPWDEVAVDLVGP